MKSIGNALNKLLSLLRSGCLWVSAAILVILPAAVAADYGGVLRWTHYVAGLASLLVVLLAVASLTRRDGWNHRRQLLLIPLILWLSFAWFQTISLPTNVVGLLSPGSVEAYTDWINPLVTSQQQLESFPISIARHQSLHVCALLCILIGIAWASAALFHERQKIVLLLCAISLGAAFHASIGLWRMVFPDTEAWRVATETTITAFGAFVNRNNAALMLNLGLAFSLGLLAWRLTALSGMEVDDPSFEWNDLLSLTGDRDSFIGLVGAVLCISGLLVCGSRGGLVAACFGMLLALGWMRQRRGFISVPVIGTVVALSVALLLVPLDLDLESIRRLEVFANQDSTTILNDGRLLHWRDGLDAAVAHMPMGSGLSTYAYAYLPHQQTSPQVWFHHADNLWLELITEQGVVGVAMAISIIVIVILALQRLALSPDPIDHGLRITGWYCLAAILVSQLFDFGLITLGNLLVVAILIPAIISRAQSQVANSATATLVPTTFQRIGVVGPALVSIVLMCAALPLLKQDAQIETLTRSIDAALERSEADPDVLADLAAELAKAGGADPSPIVLDTLSVVEYRRARLIEVMESDPQSVEQLRQRYQRTGRELRRLEWLKQNGEDDSSANYVRPFELATQSLTVLPLNPRMRWTILYLDFVARDPQLTLSTLTQLQRFYPNDPGMLFRIGNYAAGSGQHELAAQVWHEALKQDPNWTVRVLAVIDQHPDMDASSVLPSQPETLRRAVPHLLRDVTANQAVLRVALDGIRCETCETKLSRSRCEELGGDVAYALGRENYAFDEYRQSLLYNPSNANLRIKLIKRLLDGGHRRAAYEEARQGRATHPDDARFAEMIESMMQTDLDELMENR